MGILWLLQGRKFSIKGLLSDRENVLAPTFDGGSMVIFRLAPRGGGGAREHAPGITGLRPLGKERDVSSWNFRF